MNLNEFQFKFEKLHSRSLRFNDYGFDTLEDCLKSMPRTVDVRLNFNETVVLPADEFIRQWEQEDRQKLGSGLAGQEERKRLLKKGLPTRPGAEESMPAVISDSSVISLPESVKGRLKSLMLHKDIGERGIAMHSLMKKYRVIFPY